MTDLLVLVDTSVLLCWFRADDSAEDARAIREAHRDGALTAYVLDVTIYELAELLLSTLRWPPARVADQIDDVLVICGPPLTMSPTWRRDAVAIAAEHTVTFSDASLAAAARALGATLLSTHDSLVKVGVAQTPARFVTEHGAHLAAHIRKTP